LAGSGERLPLKSSSGELDAIGNTHVVVLGAGGRPAGDRRYIRSAISSKVAVCWERPRTGKRQAECKGVNMSIAGAMVNSREPVPIGEPVYIHFKELRLIGNAKSAALHAAEIQVHGRPGISRLAGAVLLKRTDSRLYWPQMPPAPITAAQTRRFLVIMWVGMFATLPIYYFLTTIIRTDYANPNSPVIYPLLGSGIFMVLASFYFKARFGFRPGQERSLAMVRASYVIALVFTEVPAILGIVVYVLSAWPNTWVFLAISAAGYFLNFPARTDFERFDSKA
jgi:hypothetical protein